MSSMPLSRPRTAWGWPSAQGLLWYAVSEAWICRPFTETEARWAGRPVGSSQRIGGRFGKWRVALPWH